MSQLANLKQTIDSIAQDAQRTGGNLANFRQKFNQSVHAVQQTIGGSAQRKDQEVILAVLNAQARVNDAIQALELAARTARDYGQSL